MTTIAWHSAALSCCVLLPLLAGCPGGNLEPVTPAGGGGTGIAGAGDNIVGPEPLTAAETDAIRSVLQTPAQLAQAVITAQAVVNGSATAQCPAVTTADTTSNISFGAGCTVTTAPEFVCSGAATATRTDQTTGLFARGSLALTLQGVSCASSPPVNGNVDVFFTATTPTDLNGTWNLSYSQAGAAATLAGTGDLQYDSSRRFVNILSFNGQLTAGGASRPLSLLGLVLSRAAGNSSVPFTGTATITGPDIRELTIIFNANSPTTGEIQVSADGGPPFTMNINNL